MLLYKSVQYRVVTMPTCLSTDLNTNRTNYQTHLTRTLKNSTYLL